MIKLLNMIKLPNVIKLLNMIREWLKSVYAMLQ
jgi:hypothetical protein